MVNNNPNKAKHLFCHFISKAGIARLKGHLIGRDHNCTKCLKLTPSDRNEVLRYENARKSKALAVKNSKKALLTSQDGKGSQSEDDDVVIVEDNTNVPKKAKKWTALVKPSVPSSSVPLTSELYL